MEDKVLEEIQFHQDTVSRDVNSPLHLIREKEMEISGRVLAAKHEAEEIVAAARKRAVEAVQKAEEDGARLAAEQEKVVLAKVEQEIEQIKSSAVEESATLRKLIADRQSGAVEYVVKTVTSV